MARFERDIVRTRLGSLSGRCTSKLVFCEGAADWTSGSVIGLTI